MTLGWLDPDHQATWDEPKFVPAPSRDIGPVHLRWDGRDYVRETPELRELHRWLEGPAFGSQKVAVKKKRRRREKQRLQRAIQRAVDRAIEATAAQLREALECP